MIKRIISIASASVLLVAVIIWAVIYLAHKKDAETPIPVPAPETESTETTATETETSYEYIEKSEGLEFEFSEDGNSYTVIGIGTCTDRDIVLPEVYEGKPVTAIGESAFAEVDFDSITFSNVIKSIGDNAFLGCGAFDIYFYGSKRDWVNVENSGSIIEYCTCTIYPTEKIEDDWGIVIN